MATKAQQAHTEAHTIADDGSARALHARAVSRAEELRQRVAQATADVQTIGAQLANLDAQQAEADQAVARAAAGVESARRALLDKQAAALLAQGEPTEAEHTAGVQSAQAAYDGAVREHSQAQATQAAKRAELAPQREQLQAQHQEARSSRADQERLAEHVAEHVALTKAAAGAEAAAEILGERAALRARIVAARAEIDEAYASVLKLSESVEVRMASYPDHIADVRRQMPDYLEPRRQLVEALAGYLDALTLCGGKAGTSGYIAIEMNLPEVLISNAPTAGSGVRQQFSFRRRDMAKVLDELAKIAGEE
jgi:chromosome segregation ATPase